MRKDLVAKFIMSTKILKLGKHETTILDEAYLAANFLT